MKKVVILLVLILLNIYLVSAGTDFKDGDIYLGNNDWVWDLNDLLSSNPQKIGIRSTDSSNKLPEECISLPSDYAEICFDSLTVGEKSYRVYSFVIETQDLSGAGGEWTSLTAAPTLHIATSKTGGIEIDSQYTNDIWLYKKDEAIQVFYEDPNGQAKYSTEITTDSETKFANTYYSSTLLDLKLENALTDNPTIKISESVNSEIKIVLGIEESTIKKLGNTKYQAEASEIVYNKEGTDLTLGHKDEDHRTLYGIIIRNPQTYGSEDQVLFDIPMDQVKAKITIQKDGQGLTKEVELGKSLSAQTLDKSTITGLLDGTCLLSGEVKEIYETIETEEIFIQTSLSSSKDEYGSDIIMEPITAKYYLNFDQNQDLNQLSETQTLNTQFLGDYLTIYQTENTKITTTICSESWSCTDWSVCTTELSQSRTCTDINACGTTDNKPTEIQTCTSCTTNWQCTDWTTTCISGEETRTCSDSTNCETIEGKPVETRNCNCIPEWECTPWSNCYRGEQKRACTDKNHCGTTEGKPGIKKICSIEQSQTQKPELAQEPDTEFPKEESEEGNSTTGLKFKWLENNKQSEYSRVIWLILGIIGGGILAYVLFLIKENHKKQPKWYLIGPMEQIQEKIKAKIKPKKEKKEVPKKTIPIKVEQKKLVTKASKETLREKIKKSLSVAGWKTNEINKAMKDISSNSKPKIK